MVRGGRKYAFNPPKIRFRPNILFRYYPPTYSHYITTDIVPVRWNDLFLGPSEPRVILLNRTAAAINNSTPGDSVDPRTPHLLLPMEQALVDVPAPHGKNDSAVLGRV
jgi:hypothetical protein